MSDTLPERREAPSGPRVLGLLAVCLGVAALAAATFVLSYPGIHAIALRAGISPRLAKGYPLLLDAMLVVVLAALLYLRGAGVLSKLLAWLTLLALLGAAAGADALHAANDKLPARTAEISAAVLPWALVFLAFVLLLAMLGHARTRRLNAPQPQSAAASDIVPGFRTLPGQERSPSPYSTAHDAAIVGAEAIPVPAREGGASSGQADVPQLKLTVPRQRRPAWVAKTEVGVGLAEPEHVLTEPGETEPVRSDPVQSDPVQSEPVQSETVQSEAAQSEPMQSESVQSEPVQSEPEVSEPAQPQPATAEIVATEPPQPAMAEIVATEPQLVETEPAAPTDPDPEPDLPVFHRISSSPVPPDSV